MVMCMASVGMCVVRFMSDVFNHESGSTPMKCHTD